jgi:DNA-binding NarL/FixJ family response regulator
MNFYPVQLKDQSKITVEEIMNVVLVDDSLLVRERVANIISEIPGVKVIGGAGNSREAIAVVRKTNPDVVMLDIKMPGESGLQVLKKLRNEFEELKIVMLTNYSDSQYKAECLMHGADYFLSKSDEFEELPELFSKLGKTQIGKLKKIN